MKMYRRSYALQKVGVVKPKESSDCLVLLEDKNPPKTKFSEPGLLS